MTNKEAIRILSRQEAIDALATYKNVGNKGDTIYRQDAIRVVSGLDSNFVKYIEELPSAQPEITDEQAIEHLQSTGWMKNHDKQMYEMGLNEKLADDSDSYDSFMGMTTT